MFKCDHCDKKSDDVKYIPCPFAQEIYDEELWSHHCDECYYQACQDI